MQYTGIDRQIRKNNLNSVILLVLFPAVLLGMVYAFLFFLTEQGQDPNELFLQALPFVLLATGGWFLIAWGGHAAFIRMATNSKSLDRKENKRVYNLLENLCISQGMKMPRLYIIEDDSLNAFASGIGERSYSISLSKGIIERLDDDELEGVIAHELTHITSRLLSH